MAAHIALASTLAFRGGQPLTPATCGLLSGAFVVAALWTLSQLWRPPETRWRWGARRSRGQVPISDFAVIVLASTIFCFSGATLASGLGANVATHTLQVMACVGFMFIAAACLHDYIRAAVKPPQAPPVPPPDAQDQPPNDPNA